MSLHRLCFPFDLVGHVFMPQSARFTGGFDRARAQHLRRAPQAIGKRSALRPAADHRQRLLRHRTDWRAELHLADDELDWLRCGHSICLTSFSRSRRLPGDGDIFTSNQRYSVRFALHHPLESDEGLIKVTGCYWVYFAIFLVLCSHATRPSSCVEFFDCHKL